VLKKLLKPFKRKVEAEVKDKVKNKRLRLRVRLREPIISRVMHIST
jgi:hypothetical protein